MEIIDCLKELRLPRQIVELILFTEWTLEWCLARCLKMTNRPGVALRGHWHLGYAKDGPWGKLITLAFSTVSSNVWQPRPITRTQRTGLIS